MDDTSASRFNRYFSNAELAEELCELKNAYPDLMELSTLGESYERRPLWLVTLTNRETGSADRKPAMWADANLHATEIAGTTVIVCLIRTLLHRYRAGDAQAARILDSSAFYLAPRLCPDGVERVFLSKPELHRSGVRSYPYTDIGEGLHCEDIDGDGRLLQMRIPDPTGDWKISSLHPDLMEKRRPHENGGTYYRLLPEAMLHSFDGVQLRLAREKSYLDFNRNFPSFWRPEGSQLGAGPYPASELEVRAVVDFVSSRKNINLALLYHTYGGLFLRPWDDRSDDTFEVGDLRVYNSLGQIAAELTGYEHGPSSKLMKYHPKEHITGAEDTWMFDHFGIFAWVVELWNLVKAAGITQGEQIEWVRNHSHADDLQILQWYQSTVPHPDAYVKWYPFQHPQLGPIELGGWNKLYSFRNPPPAFMGREAEKNVEAALALAETLPRLSVQRLEVRRLADGTFYVLLVVENAGFLPTFTSEHAKKTKAVRPVRVELTLPNGSTLISGKTKLDIGHLEGRSNKLSVSGFGFVASETDNRVRVEWVIQAPMGSQIQIDILSERSGSITVTQQLH